jgi:RHS repeat-associated protein
VLARYEQSGTIDEPIAELRSGSTTYYEAEGLGSVTSLSNSAGALANTYTYDSFGNLTASTGSVTNRFQYTGREFDPETGIYYYRSRFYDSISGRFVNEDPIRFGGKDLNLYRYVWNSSTNFRDPRGLTGVGYSLNGGFFWGCVTSSGRRLPGSRRPILSESQRQRWLFKLWWVCRSSRLMWQLSE